MPELIVKLLPTQAKAHANTTSTWVEYSGGLGSGKSWFLGLEAGVLSHANSKKGGAKKDWAGILMCPTVKEFKRDVLPIMMDLYGNMKGFKYMENSKDHGQHFMFPWNSKPLYVISAETRLKGPNVGYALLNEHSSIKWERIQQVVQRIRGNDIPRPQIIFCGTPEDDFGWVDDWVDKHTKTGKLASYTAPTAENIENVGEQYIQNLKDTLDEKSQRLYLYGERIRLGGDYFYYSFKPEVNLWDGCVYDPNETVHATIDFNVGRMTATFWHIYGVGRGKQAMAFNCLELTENGSNTRDMGNAIIKLYGLDCILTIDSAAKNRSTSARRINGVIQTDAIILKQMGFKEVRFKSANPPMRKRQLQQNGLLATRRMLAHPTNCMPLVKDWKKVKQDPATFEKSKKDASLTHASDGADYLGAFEFPYPKDGNSKSFRQGII